MYDLFENDKYIKNDLIDCPLCSQNHCLMMDFFLEIKIILEKGCLCDFYSFLVIVKLGHLCLTIYKLFQKTSCFLFMLLVSNISFL